MKLVMSLVLACLLGAPIARAQPASGEKDEAKALLQSGLRLFAANDFVGALAVFREAYQRFPSPKILLNIGTTLLKLERRAEAANTYARYLETSDDGDVAKREEATRVLAALDRELGIIDLTITPKDAEVQVGSDEWEPAAQRKRTRVTSGTVTVQARRSGYLVFSKKLEVAANETRQLPLSLVVDTSASGTNGGGVDGGISAQVDATRSSRFGVLVVAHIDPVNQGGAALIGAILDATNRVQVQAAALLGPAPGGYVGGSFAILTGRVRPLLSAGMPVFISDGPRFAIRGAGGVEFSLTRQIALVAELGVEHLFNPETSVTPTLFIPAVGAIGRL